MLTGILIFSAINLYHNTHRPLSAQVQQQLTQISQLQAQPSQAFTYLIGMTASEGQDPVVYGRQKLPAYIQAAQDPNTQEGHYDHDAFTLNAPLDCNMRDTACIDHFFDDKLARQSAIHKYPHLLTRYLGFQHYRDFHQPYPFSIYLTADYSPLLKGQQVLLLDQIQRLEDGQTTTQRMQQTVIDDLTYWRNALSHADNLIHKMIFIKLMRNDLDILAEMYLRFGTRPPEIAALTPAERDMTLPNAFETQAMSVQLSHMTNQTCASGFKECFEAYKSRLLFNPEGMINLVSAQRSKRLGLAALTLSAMAAQAHQETLEPNYATWLSNPIGAILAKASHTDFAVYVFRESNLNLLITLLNQIHGQLPTDPAPVWLQSITNPYGPSYGHAYIDQGWLCLKSASPDDSIKTSEHCIPWHSHHTAS